MLQFGFAYTLKPFLDYEKGYCNYSCIRCSQVCPTGAIGNINADEKHTIQIGVAEFFIDRCVVNTEGTDCGACSEHCPTQAVHMVPYTGTLTIPKVEENLCIGCGGCESICPVRPKKAIIVKALKIHKIVEVPEEEEATQVEVDEFGF
jgi:ferredoxin